MLTLLAPAAAGDWPRFRGENGSGVAPDGALPSELHPERTLAWKTGTVPGNSSPIVVAGRVLFTGHQGDERLLLCLDASTGRELWRRGFTRTRTEGAHPLNGPTTPTPVTDSESVYAFFPEFGLIAWDLAGNERWRAPMGPFPSSIQGIASSPVYAGGVVAMLIDTTEESYLAAYDAASGKLAWKAQRGTNFLGGYSTPAVYKPSSGPLQIVVAASTELTGYQASTGERLWWAPVSFAPAAMPLVAGDHVFTVEPAGGGAPPFTGMLKQFDRNNNGAIEREETAGSDVNSQIMARLFRSIDRSVGNGDGIVNAEEYNKSFHVERSAGGLVRTRLGGSGDVSQSHVGWRHTKGLPYTTAPLLYQGVLYLVRDGGILTCFEPESGKVLREERMKDAPGAYYASPVAGDGKVYLVSHAGKATVLSAAADAKWEIVSQHDFDEPVVATPAIAGGRIFLRTAKALYAFGTREPAGR